MSAHDSLADLFDDDDELFGADPTPATPAVPAEQTSPVSANPTAWTPPAEADAPAFGGDWLADVVRATPPPAPRPPKDDVRAKPSEEAESTAETADEPSEALEAAGESLEPGSDDTDSAAEFEVVDVPEAAADELDVNEPVPAENGDDQAPPAAATETDDSLTPDASPDGVEPVADAPSAEPAGPEPTEDEPADESTVESLPAVEQVTPEPAVDEMLPDTLPTPEPSRPAPVVDAQPDVNENSVAATPAVSPTSDGPRRVSAADVGDVILATPHHARSDRPARRTAKLFIAGALCRSRSGASAPAATGAHGIADVPVAGTTDADIALEAALRAARSWSSQSPLDRARTLHRLLVETELVSTVNPTERDRAAALWCHYIGWPDKMSAGLRVSGSRSPAVAVAPAGLHGIVSVVAPVLAAGSTVVVVIDAADALLVETVADLCMASSVPNGAVNIVTGTDPSVLEFLTGDPRTTAVDFARNVPGWKGLAAAAAARGVAVRNPDLSGEIPYGAGRLKWLAR